MLYLNKLINEKFINQFENDFMFVASMEIGINEWFSPQISEHWPKNIPERLILKDIWFNRPGIASNFKDKAGIVHEWITSEELIIFRIWVLNGIIKRLSTSNKLKIGSLKFNFK